jgi:hypothetical protein
LDIFLFGTAIFGSPPVLAYPEILHRQLVDAEWNISRLQFLTHKGSITVFVMFGKDIFSRGG